MTLKDTYQRFLDLPNPISLAENASLHYITTLTTFSQPTQIIRHLESHNKKVVKTRSTRILSVVEGGFALALEVETNLEFISGGGVYLPGLENFVVDKIATIPTVSVPWPVYAAPRLTETCRLTSYSSMRTARFRKSEYPGIKARC
jgi:hypothetical protein